MSKDPKVTSLQDIGKLSGVSKVVVATEKRREARIEDLAERLVGAMVPEAVSGDGDLNALLNFKPSEFVKEGKKTAAILTDELSKLEELVGKLGAAKETLRKIREANTKKGIRGSTNEIRQLEAMMEAGEKAFDATDEEVKNLYRFRRDHAVLRELVDSGHKTFKAMRKGEKADEAAVKELSVGYADLLHALIREDRIMEVPAETLERWGKAHESFGDHAASWFYRDCKTCPNGRCRTHWFWGINGDDQSIQLAKDLRALNNINSRIRNHLNPRRLAPTKSVAAPITSASAPTDEALGATVPDELPSSTPVEPENGSTES